MVYYAGLLDTSFFFDDGIGTLQKLLYPGDSGYYNPELNEHMRNSETIEKIRDYHKRFYKAENIVLIISGKIDQHQIFKRLASIERKILDVKNETEFKRPGENPSNQLETKATI